ncbi:ATP-binding protein [Nocardiopsis sp. NPDC050513]|uniref:ATP-binding protein n=1 Tax=Nocardiopsis sp. NPDC050513 TaxID=3364338 RepID=UPI003789D773
MDRLRLPSTLASVEAAEEWAWRIADASGLDGDGRHRLGLAVREAVANAVLHGNRSDPGRFVDLRLREEGDRLRVEVGDDGEGFTPSAAVDRPDHRAPVDLSPSGRGVAIIRRLVDEFTVTRRHTPPGTVVVLGMARGTAAPHGKGHR